MADKITWILDADASRVKAEMNSAVANVNDASRKIRTSWDNVNDGHENLLRSSHRVSTQIHSVARDLASGASAGDVFAASLEGIGRSLNISLGALAGLAIGSVLVQKIYAIREEFKKLQQELKDIHDVAGANPEYKSMSALEEGAAKAQVKIKSLKDEMNTLVGGGASGLLQDIKDTISGTGYKERGGQVAQLQGDTDSQLSAAAAKLNAATALRSGGLPDYQVKAVDAQIKFNEEVLKSVQSLDLLSAQVNKLNQTYKEIADAATKKHEERAGMSLKELADMPSRGYQVTGSGKTGWSAGPTLMSADTSTPDMTPERYRAGIQAQQALALDAEAEKLRLSFNPQGAHAAFNAADDMKAGIQNLKPSERMSADFKGALVVTEEYLKQISDNTKAPLVNQ